MTDTTYIHADAVPGVTYYFKVRAMVGKSASDYSSVSYICADCAQPVLTLTLNAAGKPVLTWETVSGATSYEIYRAPAVNGPYSKLDTISDTTLTDTTAAAGNTY